MPCVAFLTRPPPHAGELPFDLRTVTFVTSMSWGSSPNAAGVDRRATLVAHAPGLKLAPSALTWLTAIAGPRYNPATRQLRIAADAHATGAGNKRAALETLVSLVKEASRLGAKHGALPAPRRMPKYSHV
jgi:hypothetical protein